MIFSEGTKHGIAGIAGKYGISLVVLFGSVAANAARPDSDLDIAVKFADGNTDLRRILDLQHADQERDGKGILHIAYSGFDRWRRRLLRRG